MCRNVPPRACDGRRVCTVRVQMGARGKRRGFSPGAAARPLERTRVREDCAKTGVSWIQSSLVRRGECHGSRPSAPDLPSSQIHPSARKSCVCMCVREKMCMVSIAFSYPVLSGLGDCPLFLRRLLPHGLVSSLSFQNTRR